MGIKLRPADFAKQAGVTKQAVHTKIKNKTLVVDDAGFLDTDNPINSAYISDTGRKRRNIVPFPVSGAPAPIAANFAPQPGGVAPAPMTEADIAAAAGVPATELLNYTLRDVVIKFSGIYNLEKHARTLRDITMAADKEMRMQERSLRLIPKDFVTSRVFPFLNMLMKQLIEYPEAVADNIVSKVLADGPGAREAVILIIRDGLSRIIAKSKEQVIKELDSLRSRHGLGGDTEEPTDDEPSEGGENE
jgi:hypothetical protein